MALGMLHGLGGDLRLATRRLLATPQFLVFAVLSLAVGIAVTTAVYSILYSLIWKPQGFADPDRLVVIAAPGLSSQTVMRAYLSRPDFDDVRASARSFSATAASAPFYQSLVTDDASEVLEGEAVTGDYFRTVGVTAALGRTIQPHDDETSARVIVLNHRVWRGRFEADPLIVGRTVRLGGQPFEVIGVAPRTFDGIERMPRRAGGWIPLRSLAAFAGGSPVTETRERRTLTVVARRAPGRSIAAASAELGAIARQLDADFPQRKTMAGDAARATLPRSWSARGIEDANAADSRVAALIVALVALVLIVACTNLANLMLARGSARQREFAVRRALGAARWRLVRELAIESGIVAVLGGAAALALLRVLLVMATVEIPTPGRTFSLEPELNLPAIAIAGGALLLALIVFGLEPAVQLTRRTVTAELTGGDVTLGAPPQGRQRAFIRWQVAISATFFLIAAVLARVVAVEARHDPGIDLDRLAIGTIFLPPKTWSQERATRALNDALTYLRREPGIEHVAISTGVPFGLSSTVWARATTPDRPFLPNRTYEMTDLLASTPDIFRTLGVPMVTGRAFDDRDDAAAPRVMVVSEKSARAFFGTADAVGRQLMLQAWGRPPTETYTVVGIARDTDSGRLMSRGNDTVYVPLAQHYEPFAVILARAAGSTRSAARLIQKSVRRADPDMAVASAGPAFVIMSGPYFAARIAAPLAAVLGLLTLALAMVGLYGVQSHLVMRRTRELGLRMAIGASSTQIERMLLRDGIAPVIQGILLGIMFGVLARLLLRALVSASIQPVDPVAFPLVPIPLVVAAFVACYLPARRAARVDPNEALRHL